MGNKIGRNQPCPCGSGLKYKKCCLERSAAAETKTGTSIERFVADGYRWMAEGRSDRACECWADAWNALRSRLVPEMRTTSAADTVFTRDHFLFNWIQDFALELGNAALDEPAYAIVGVDLCRRALAQFPDEHESFQVDLRAALGQLLFLAGRHDDGTQVLEELIRDCPNRAIGYVFLADMLGLGPRPGADPLDRHRAVSLLEQALAYPVADAADFDLELRLTDMRDRSTASASPPAR